MAKKQPKPNKNPAPTTPEPKGATAVPEPESASASAGAPAPKPAQPAWAKPLALALFGGGLVAALLPLGERPGFALSFPPAPIIRLWILGGLVGALLGAVGKKAAPPAWLEKWSDEEGRDQTLANYFLRSALVRVAAVFLASRFFAIPLHPVHALPLGVSLAVIELFHDALAYTIFQKKSANARKLVWLFLVLFFGGALLFAAREGLFPGHLFPTATNHIFAGPVWFLIPTAPTLIDLVNSLVSGDLPLLAVVSVSLLAFGSLALLYQAPKRVYAAGLLTAALAVSLLAPLRDDTERRQAIDGAQAAKETPKGWQNKKAPELMVAQHTGDSPPKLSDYPDKVKVLYFFQSY